MIKLIRKILGLCDHKWTIIRSGPIKRVDGSVKGYYYDLQCEKCGNIKSKET